MQKTLPAYTSNYSSKLLEFIFTMDPKISIDDLFSFIKYISLFHGTRIFDNAAALELLKWGIRTNFIHFTPDTLPIILIIILGELAKPGEPSTNLKFLLQMNFHDLIREKNGVDLDCALQDKSEDWMAKLHVAISQWILISKEAVPYSLERTLVRIISDEVTVDIPCIFFFTRDIVTASLSNNIKLNFNWRFTDK
ncbi:3e7fcd30-5b64-4dcb-b83d-b369ac8906a6-CDS [Sclerotinia trifoliorum]|uniref:3e7fcd30-5b64-4dcb-b83d-b369ac8906a6-CDS n=1 Tax=Sclerotinia trifoliorum TaxID=28548 RepID=A0A8H2W430_9HELO|nr:3e7fcd30-5b64-4dcb-b83d-b369ac8906a6-CDS [Sclerotinia trifoliorum]